MGCNHFANLLSHRSVKDSFNRKLTTIVLNGVTKSDAGSKKSVLNESEWNRYVKNQGARIGVAKRDKEQHNYGNESKRIKKSGINHLVNLLSIKGVKKSLS